MSHEITIARGDGIGPEIMEACLAILEAAGADLKTEEVTLGEKAFLAGHASGVEPAAWDSIRRTRVLYKAPLTTPQGGGYKSVNVTLRKSLGLFANVRPTRSFAPCLATKHPEMDLVVVRENEEDVYGGIEHQQTDEVVQCLKLITRPGSERICRFAFEYARANGRKRVSCFTKDNIMKLTDGLFHRVFDEVAAEYPDIEAEHQIVDIGSARLAASPELFDVVVVPNLYGDILSDIAAQLMGSVGLAGSSNIGEQVAMFEAVHGSAPDIAGRGIGNPLGLLNAGVMMLQHLGEIEAAERVANAWLTTLEDGIATGDLQLAERSRPAASTSELRDAVIERLGRRPSQLQPFVAAKAAFRMPVVKQRDAAQRECVGVDVFVRWNEAGRRVEYLADALKLQPAMAMAAGGDSPHRYSGGSSATMVEQAEHGLSLSMITNRGQKVWPNGAPETFCTDHWRCRYLGDEGGPVTPRDIIALLSDIAESGVEVVKTENLYTFDGVPGFSAGQGQ